MTLTEVTLKPCPRCGGRAFITGVDSYAVWCVQDNCLQMPPRSSRAEAITAWNQRASTDQSRVAVLEEALRRFAGIKAEDGDDFSTLPPQAIVRCEITAEDLHVARAALNDTSHSEEHTR